MCNMANTKTNYFTIQSLEVLLIRIICRVDLKQFLRPHFAHFILLFVLNESSICPQPSCANQVDKLSCRSIKALSLIS